MLKANLEIPKVTFQLRIEILHILNFIHTDWKRKGKRKNSLIFVVYSLICFARFFYLFRFRLHFRLV